MDLEHLTKHQILLLTLLVSFVTSIATGIVTVSLMDQAPSGVTRTINQIVERTVEKVVPAELGAASGGTERTVVVKEDDLAAQSIAHMQKAIVRIVERGGTELVARAVLVGNDGTALSDYGALFARGTERFEAILSSGQRVAATLREGSNAVAVLDLDLGTSTPALATRAEVSNLKLGQTVVRIGGLGADTVGVGVIASLPSSLSDGGEATVEATVESQTPGAVLMTLFGEVVGITTSQSRTLGGYFYTVPMSVVSAPAP